MRLVISDRGTRAVVEFVDELGERVTDMQALVPIIRARWGESEGRILNRGAGWAPRLASTRRRYRWSVNGQRADPRVGRVSGRMHAALTSPSRDAIRQDVSRASVTFGPKVRGPVAHANIFSAGRGRQQARPAVDFDDRGLEDAATDITRFLVGEHAARRGGQW